MPPTSYTMVHWGSTLTPLEKAAMQKWIRDERLKISATWWARNTAIPHRTHHPDKLPADPAKVELGYKLFHDVRLSTDNTVSAQPAIPWKRQARTTWPLPRAYAPEGRHQRPTVFNAAFHTKQFWDGRAANLQEQAGGPPLNPVEMGYEHPDDWNKIAAS